MVPSHYGGFPSRHAPDKANLAKFGGRDKVLGQVGGDLGASGAKTQERGH